MDPNLNKYFELIKPSKVLEVPNIKIYKPEKSGGKRGGHGKITFIY